MTPFGEGSARRSYVNMATTLATDRLPCPDGIRNRNPSTLAAADPCFGPRSLQDRLELACLVIF